MSKIYEALLRAELDRLAFDGPGSGRQHGAIATEEVPSGTAISTLITEREAQPSSYSGGLAGPGRVRKSLWTPCVDKLPVLQRRGLLLEQFRSLRTRFLEMKTQTSIKSILISSALPQEGKSFVAANLALSLALHKNSRVLLIDGDMRRHTLHNTLGCELGLGLAEYLAGKASLLDTMQQTLPLESMPNNPVSRLETLTFISAGTAGDSAADLSASKRLPQLITAAAPHFDWIVIDSSPANLVSDATNLAQACDGILLVARSGVTQVAAAGHALSGFRQEKLLGFVLNGAADVSRPGGYYGYDAPEAEVASL